MNIKDIVLFIIEMWVTCHTCDGYGFIRGKKITFNHMKQKVPCHICNPRRFIIDTIMLGQIWVEDNYFPITPPSSP